MPKSNSVKYPSTKDYYSENSGFRIVNPLLYNNWNELISNFIDYSFFHTKEWCETLFKSYNFIPLYLIKSDNKVSCICPFMLVKRFSSKKHLVSLPFSDYCEPLFTNNDFSLNHFEHLKEVFNSYHYASLELRTTYNLGIDTINSQTDFVHKIKLEIPSILLKNLSRTTKQNINKAEKGGVKIKVDNSLPALEIFYYLQCITRKRHGLPPQPEFYFKNLFDVVFSKNMGDIFLAYHNNEPIASGLFLKFDKKVIFKYANSNYTYQNLRANNLLTWEALNKYQSSGFEEFDFGRTEVDNLGLRKYKLGYNAEEKKLFNYLYLFKKNEIKLLNSRVSHYPTVFLRHLPINSLKFLGKIFYPRMG